MTFFLRYSLYRSPKIGHHSQFGLGWRSAAHGGSQTSRLNCPEDPSTCANLLSELTSLTKLKLSLHEANSGLSASVLGADLQPRSTALIIEGLTELMCPAEMASVE